VGELQELTSGVITLPPGIPAAMVLIAAYDLDTSTALAQSLEAGGYTVVLALSPGDAARLAQTHSPDAIIIESLPDGDSLALCRLIKQDVRAFIPVILVTPHESEAEAAATNPAVSPDALLVDPPLAEIERWLHSLLRIRFRFHPPPALHDQQARTFAQVRNSIMARISHELGTPLLQVKSAVALLIEDLIAIQHDDEHDLTLMATKAVARLEHLVDNIRNLTHMDELHLEPISLPEAADYAVRLINRKWATHGSAERIENRLPDDLPPVLGDKIGLGNLLQLLLDNALRFSATDAPIHILGCLDDSDHVWIGVRDFGIGIPAHEQEHIFEPFYKVNDSISQHQGGPGVGLSLAQMLAAGMNTIIHVESAPGKGSTFSLILPAVFLPHTPT